MVKTLKLLFLPAALALALFVACNKSDEVTTDDAVDQALYSLQERGGMGRFGCYELVFPVTLTLPDGTTAEVDSYDEMKQTLRNYFDGGGNRRRPHPEFVFPISVVSQDGEVITVNSQDELRVLREACAGTFDHHGPQGHGQHGLSCFELVFPITLQFPDSTTAQVGSRQEMREQVRAWHAANPGVHERPQVVFPITVQMVDDGTTVTVNNRDELRALKENCD